MSASESSTVQPNTPAPAIEIPANAPKVPVLGEGFQETPRDAVSKTADSSDAEQEAVEGTGEGAKTGKRRLFGFGKKKVSAYKYAINLVTLSLTMKNQFAAFWNSIRHKAELDVLDEDDPDLVLLFDVYNNLHCQLRDHHKLEDQYLAGQSFAGKEYRH